MLAPPPLQESPFPKKWAIKKISDVKKKTRNFVTTSLCLPSIRQLSEERNLEAQNSEIKREVKQLIKNMGGMPVLKRPKRPNSNTSTADTPKPEIDAMADSLALRILQSNHDPTQRYRSPRKDRIDSHHFNLAKSKSGNGDISAMLA